MVQGLIITGGLECSDAPLFRADAWIPWFVYGLQGLLVLVCIYLVRLLNQSWQKAVTDSERGDGHGNDEERGDSGSNSPAAERLQLEHVDQRESVAQASKTDANAKTSASQAANCSTPRWTVSDTSASDAGNGLEPVQKTNISSYQKD